MDIGIFIIEMKLIVGLGNPGERYKFSPHNLGFMVVDKMAYNYKTHFRKSLSKLETAEFRLGLEKIILAKPLTFMNLSGIAVSEILKTKRIKENNLLIVCDDVNLSLGKIRIRRRGSDGGHLGLRSIIEELRTQGFSRLRIGIGKEKIADISRYVLERFSKEDLELTESVVNRAVDAILFFIKEGIDKAMNRFN